MKESILDMLKRHEGVRLYPYYCPAGKLTIGVGRNVEDKGFSPEEKEELFGDRNLKDTAIIAMLSQKVSTKEPVLTDDQVLYLLRNDISQCMTKLRANLPYFDHLTEARQNVLIDMCFNMGWHGLMAFQKMFAALEIAHYTAAAKEMMDSKWARHRQVGERASELSAMMREG